MKMDWFTEMVTDTEKLAKVQGLESIAKELDCTVAQLSLAWCLKNPFVSSVITGASRIEQLQENMKASEVAPKLTSEILERIEKIFGTWKRCYGLRRIRWRGIAKAACQIHLTAIAYNLKRTFNIVRPAA